jgi:hypothetical protein
MSSFIPPSQNGQSLELDLRDLSVDHPLLVGIPVWDGQSPEFAALRDDVRTRGLLYPLLIDNAQRVVDGRNRRNVVRALGGLGGANANRVPCRVVSQDEAASIIVSCLIHRRQHTKGALAYLVAPLFEQVLTESKNRRAANLRNVDSPLSGVSAKTADDVAAQLGIGHTLFEQAIKLRRMFAEMGEEVRAKYEPRILGTWIDEAGDAQDPVGLGYMINGLVSLAADQAGKKNLGKRAQHDRLFVSFLPKLGLHWKKANPEQREAIATKLKAEVMKFPAELRDEIAGAIRAAAKAEK